MMSQAGADTNSISVKTTANNNYDEPCWSRTNSILGKTTAIIFRGAKLELVWIRHLN